MESQEQKSWNRELFNLLLNNQRKEDKELKNKLNMVNIAPLLRTTKAPANISMFFRYLIVSLS